MRNGKRFWMLSVMLVTLLCGIHVCAAEDQQAKEIMTKCKEAMEKAPAISTKATYSMKDTAIPITATLAEDNGSGESVVVLPAEIMGGQDGRVWIDTKNNRMYTYDAATQKYYFEPTEEKQEEATEQIPSDPMDGVTYKYNGENKLDGVDCYLIEGDDQGKNSGQTTHYICYVRKSDYRMQTMYITSQSESAIISFEYPESVKIPDEIKQNAILKDGYRITKDGVVYEIFYDKNVAGAKACYSEMTSGGMTYPTKIKIADSVTVCGTEYPVTAIGELAFSRNVKLKSVTIGANVKTIGKMSFYGCKKLKSITIKTEKLTNKTVGLNAFKGISSKAVVKVPKKKLKSYKKILKKKGINGKKQKIKK